MSLSGLQFLCLLCLGSLLALTGLKQFFMEPLASPLPNLVWFLVQVLPLIAVTPGILRLRPRSYLLAALAAMLYFSHGVMVAISPAMRAYGLWEVGFAMCLVLAATFAVRHLRLAAGDDEEADRGQ
ncbi:MAG TPA: DUF2069 domain-containing protein [Pseudomonadales bacterium]